MAAVTREAVRGRLREFLLAELIGNPRYPLRDDEPLISGGLIDSLALAQILVFVENEFGVVMLDTDLTVENMDTLELMTGKVLQTAGSGDA
ncbi:MAG: acyl carrier protein [Candidatus Binatia bacterium]